MGRYVNLNYWLSGGLTWVQIEQFIESIFPTQDPRAIEAADATGHTPAPTGPSVEEAAKAKEAKEDTCEIDDNGFIIDY